jgi:hypothetical protein
VGHDCASTTEWYHWGLLNVFSDCHQNLRYKDYHLAAKPGSVPAGRSVTDAPMQTGLYEVSTVREFAAEMKRLGILHWWRHVMGFADEDDR